MDSFSSDTYFLVGHIESHKPDWRHRKRPDNAANNLIAVTKGVVYMEEAGIRYDVRQGEVLLLQHGLPSAGYRASEVPTSFYYLLFHGPYPQNIPKHFAPAHILRIYEIYETLLKQKDIIGYPPEGLNHLARYLLAETSWQASLSQGQRPNFLIEAVVDWINKNRDRNITINEISYHFHYSSDYISRLFFKQKGIKLKDYILTARMAYIDELLSDSQYSLSEVAGIAGFINTHSFLKFYKYHRKFTPSEFRKGLLPEKVL